MQIGKPQKEIYVEPLEMPEPLRHILEPQPQEQPVEVPAEVEE